MILQETFMHERSVQDDASLWYVGSNRNDMLGTGNSNPINIETMVQGPGSVRIDCRYRCSLVRA
jgi:hypothetical protein